MGAAPAAIAAPEAPEAPEAPAAPAAPAAPGVPAGAASALQFPVHIPFVESLGAELHRCADGQAEVRVDLDSRHLNHWAVAHGGVVMTLLDVAMAMAARSAGAPGIGVVTVEMKTSFMRPAQHRLRAAATVLHKTSTMAFCEATLFDKVGQRCAHATGTFKYLRALPSHAGAAIPDPNPDPQP